MAKQLQFDVLALDMASKAFASIAKAADRLDKQLDRLDGKTIDVEAEFNSRKAEAQVGAFARDTRKKLEAALKALPDIEIDADSSDAQREIARIRSEMQALADKRIGVDIDAAAARAEMERLGAELRKLGSESADIQVQTDTAEALAALKLVDAEVDRIDGRKAKVKVDVDKDLGDTVIKVAMLGKALGALALPAAAIAAAPQLAAIGSAAVTAAGAFAILPAVVASAGVAFAALKIAVSGFSDAVTADSPEKLAEAMKKLAPAAQQAVTAIRGLSGAFTSMRLDVQQRLFDGFGPIIARLGNTYLPVLAERFGRISDAANLAGRDIGTMLLAGNRVADLKAIGTSAAGAFENLSTAVKPLAAAFLDIARVGGGVFRDLTDGAGAAAQKFADFIAKARETGQLEQWMRAGANALSQLGQIAGNVGSTLLQIFRIADESGGSFLGTLERITASIKNFVSSAEGTAGIRGLFTGIREAVDAALPGLQTLVKAIAGVVAQLQQSGAFQAAGEAIGRLAEAAAPVVTVLGNLASTVLPPLLSALGAIAPLLGPIAAGFLAMTLASKGMTALSALGTRLAAGWTAASTAMTGAGAAAAGSQTAIVGAAGAAEKAATSTGKFSSVMSGVGKAIPLVAAGLVGLSVIFENASSASDKLGQAWLDGVPNLQKYKDEVASSNSILGIFGDRASDVVDRAQEMYNAMTPLQQAQVELTRATNAYGEALKAGDPAAVAAAQQRLAEATNAVEAATKSAADAAKDYNDRQRDLIASAQSVLGSQLQVEGSLARVADAQKAANDAAKQYGTNSTQAAEANRAFVTAADAAAQAAQAQAEAQAKAAGATNSADAGSRAYGATLLQIAANASGPAQTALLGYISKLDDATLSALSAGAEASGFATKILTLPDGRTVKIAIDPETGKIITTQELLDNLKDKTVVIKGETLPFETSVRDGVGAALAAQEANPPTIPVKGDTQPFASDLATAKSQADGAVGTVKLIGDPIPFQGTMTQMVQLANGQSATVTLNANGAPATLEINGVKYLADATTGTLQLAANQDPALGTLNGYKLTVDSTTGTMTLQANGAPAAGTIQQTVTFANGQTGTITLDGNQVPVNGKITGSVALADGSTGTITIDANQTPANGKVTGVVTFANGSTGTVQVTANTGAANSAISGLVSRWNGYTININTVVSSRIGGLAGGGIVGYAGGGIHGGVRHAARGLVLPGYNPGRDTEHVMLSRGEAVLVPELVRALGARRILAANAEASGGRPPMVTGQIASLMDGTIRGGPPPMSAAVTSAVSTVRGGGGTSVVNNYFSASFPSTMPGDPVALRRSIVWLKDQLRGLDREGK